MIRRYIFSPLRLLLSCIVLLVAAVVMGFAGAYQYLKPALPDVASIKDIRAEVPLRIYSRDGRLLAQFGERRSIPLTFEQVPTQLVNATLAAEDDRFFEHSGVDYAGLLRATVRHLLSGEKAEGGSTITMQVTRSIFLSPEKSYRRKMSEIFLTFRIEQQLSKQEILALYMNRSFLGQRAYGVGAAAEVYFGKTVDQLTVPEVALIAGTFRLPSRDNPVANPDLARQRRAYVLRRMFEKQHITREQYEAALATPIESRLHGPAVEVDAPYIAEMARVELLNRFGNDAYTAGYEVVTTVDSRLQQAATRAVRASLLEYDQRHGYRGPVGRVPLPLPDRDPELAQLLDEYSDRAGLQPAVVVSLQDRAIVAFAKRSGRVNIGWNGLSWARTPLADGHVGPALQRASDAVAIGDVIYVAQERAGDWRMVQIPEAQGAFVALDPQDGAITALVGGFDYYASSYNRAVQARRQPGSAFKPFLYSAALDQGFTAASIINDAPLVIDDPAQEATWRPQNSTREFRGPMRLREALVRSRNLVSIRIMDALGPSYAIPFIERFGFPEDSLPRNLSLALGTAQVAPLEMARGYAVFANGGFRVEPYFIERVRGPGGQTVFEAAPQFACAECTDPQSVTSAPLTQDALPATATTDAQRWGGITYFSEKSLAPRVISAQNAFLMTDIMSDVVRRGTATRALQLKRNDLAGKTGTTNDRRDAWFCGYNSDLVGAAWIGFDQERNLGPGEEGGRTALPMWIYFMGEALKGVPETRRVPPPGLVNMRISRTTGFAARPGEPDAMFEYFMEDQLPPQPLSDGLGSDGLGDSSGDDSLF